MCHNILPALTLLTVCAATGAFAQPDWVKAAASAPIKSAPAAEATAIVLHHTADVTFSRGNRATMRIRRALKLLSESGNALATIAEPVAPWRKLKGVRGWAVSPNGRTDDLEDSEMMEVKPAGSTTSYDDHRLFVAAFKTRKAGDVIAFEYTVQEDDWSSSYQTFAFQEQQPVRFAQYSVEVPDGWELHSAGWGLEDVVFERKDGRYTWTAIGLPYQPEEPLMPAWHDVSRHLAVACYNPEQSRSVQFPDWRSVCRWSAGLLDGPSAPDETVGAHVANLAGAAGSANEKIQAIATFVRDDIRYVAVEIGKGRWQPRPAATTLHNRFGDCKDKTTLMREMLKAAGIPSRAVLANTTHSVKPDLPTPFQFNHCIVAIPRSALSEPAAWADACAGGWFFFDPTHPSTRPGQIPDGLLGDYVLIASENDSTFYRLPERSPDSYRRAYDIVATLAQDGSVSAEVNVRDYGLRAADTRYEFSTTPPEKEKLAWTQYLSKLNPGVDITEYRNGSAGDTAWESFRIRYPKYLVHAGGLNLLKPDLIHSGEPPLLTREQRVHPINFGSARLTATSILWHLPPGWAVEGDMVPLSAGCESGNVEARVRVSNDTLRYDLTETYTGAMLGASQYGVARKFNRDLSSAKGMTLLIKRP